MTEPFCGIARHYARLLQEFGPDARPSDYRDHRTQLLKFEVLADLVPVPGSRILDVGCGLASWADYLEERNGAVDYVGMDICPPMIEQAKRRRPDLDLRAGNILDHSLSEQFDVVSANGIFYLLGEDAPALMRQIIVRMFELCRSAAAFTTLSRWGDRHQLGEFQADPLETLSFCRSLTLRILFRHDYHPGDFAVCLYKAAH